MKWLLTLVVWVKILVIHVAKDTLFVWDLDHSIIKAFDHWTVLFKVDLAIIHKGVFVTLDCGAFNRRWGFFRLGSLRQN